MEVRGLGGMTGMGETTCPPGYYPKVYTAGTGGATVGCAPKNEESLWCSWFGIGCQGPPLMTSAPKAPQTVEQMTVHGAWTPEMSAPDIEAWRTDYLAYMENNPGQARIPVVVNQAGQSALDLLSGRGVWILAGVAAVVAVIILAKRV